MPQDSLLPPAQIIRDPRGKKKTFVPQETLAFVQELRAQKVSWQKIQQAVGITSDILRRQFGYVKPGGVARYKRGKNRLGLAYDYEKPDQRILDTVPRDTRGLTARMLGDPLPGRSALDRRRG